MGIVVHSVIIGVALGASQSAKTIKPLVAVLTFHQFFEGMGLGGCISQVTLFSTLLISQFKGRKVVGFFILSIEKTINSSTVALLLYKI